MNIFFTQKVTGDVEPENIKSHGTIIDICNTNIGRQEGSTDQSTKDTEKALKRYLRVPDEFLMKFPEMSQEKANKYYNEYLQQLRQIFLKRLPYMTSNYTHLSLDKLWAKEFQYKNVRYYHYKEFNQHRPFFYAPDDKKGNGRRKGNNFEQNSQVYIMNQKLLDLLIDTGDANELVSTYYGDITDETILETVPIDINSLNNFISNTTKEIENSDKNSKYEATLYRNLRQAKYIKIISEFFYPAYGKHILPMIPNLSPYGRMYYKGINIQNISKEVRSAILGEHYVYDLNAAVYAIKLMMAKTILKNNGIDDFGHFVYTKEYLEWKSQLRIQLSQHIKKYNNPEKLVKEAITAIGFGARIGGGSWQIDGEWHTTSIEDIIMNPADRHNFMNDPWIKSFVKEQQVITQIITNEYKDSKEFIELVRNVPNMFKNNRIRRSQIMSYVFQHTEKRIMDLITKDIPVIARIHDSFITKEKLSNQQILDIKYQLKQLDPLMTIDCEDFYAWINVDNFDDESDIDEAFSKLTGVKHSMPKTKRTYSTNKFETYNDGKPYDGGCDYGQSQYDPDNDPFVEDMTNAERTEHYRILGVNDPRDNTPDFIKKYL